VVGALRRALPAADCVVGAELLANRQRSSSSGGQHSLVRFESRRCVLLCWKKIAAPTCIEIALRFEAIGRRSDVQTRTLAPLGVLLIRASSRRCGVAGIPWAYKLRRFSLRTLLIGMTMVAVALDLIFAMSR
jgi:hypothetical protein